MSLPALREALQDGLHVDNLWHMIDLCTDLLNEGGPRVPLFVFRGCLQYLRYRKAEVPVVASAVESPDREFAGTARQVLEALSHGKAGPELWPLLDELVGRVLSLPASYPSG